MRSLVLKDLDQQLAFALNAQEIAIHVPQHQRVVVVVVVLKVGITSMDLLASRNAQLDSIKMKQHTSVKDVLLVAMNVTLKIKEFVLNVSLGL